MTTKDPLNSYCLADLSSFFSSDSGAVRTLDPQLRRLLLYPTELRNHRLQHIIAQRSKGNTKSSLMQATRQVLPLIQQGIKQLIQHNGKNSSNPKFQHFFLLSPNRTPTKQHFRTSKFHTINILKNNTLQTSPSLHTKTFHPNYNEYNFRSGRRPLQKNFVLWNFAVAIPQSVLCIRKHSLTLQCRPRRMATYCLVKVFR